MLASSLPIFLFAALLPRTLAQYGGGSGASSTSAAASSSASAANPSASPSSVHAVAVGQNGLVFTPDTVSAVAGDKIEFTITAGHSVERSSFADPCNPVNTSAVFSGLSAQGGMFTVLVNDTMPIWFYCSQISHCATGMAMVVNPPTSGAQTLQAYMDAAKSASLGKDPATVQGGVLGPFQNAASSSSASASPSTSTTNSAASNGQTKWTPLIAASLLWLM